MSGKQPKLLRASGEEIDLTPKWRNWIRLLKKNSLLVVTLIGLLGGVAANINHLVRLAPSEPQSAVEDEKPVAGDLVLREKQLAQPAKAAGGPESSEISGSTDEQASETQDLGSGDPSPVTAKDFELVILVTTDLTDEAIEVSVNQLEVSGRPDLEGRLVLALPNLDVSQGINVEIRIGNDTIEQHLVVQSGSHRAVVDLRGLVLKSPARKSELPKLPNEKLVEETEAGVPAQDSGNWSLGVGVAGSGRGLVASLTNRASCETQCSYQFAPQTDVSLEIVVYAGSMFVGWLGDCSGAGRSCQLSATQGEHRSVLAVFAQVPQSPSLSSSANACTLPLELVAIPSSGKAPLEVDLVAMHPSSLASCSGDRTYSWDFNKEANDGWEEGPSDNPVLSRVFQESTQVGVKVTWGDTEHFAQVEVEIE